MQRLGLVGVQGCNKSGGVVAGADARRGEKVRGPAAGSAVVEAGQAARTERRETPDERRAAHPANTRVERVAYTDEDDAVLHFYWRARARSAQSVRSLFNSNKGTRSESI
jgi:hypothetical protein